MAAKTKKSSRPKKQPSVPAKRSDAAKKDPKALNKEIGNALFTDEERVGMFLAKHWKKIIAAAVIVVVAVTGVFAFIRHRDAVTKKVTAELAQARTIEELKAELGKDPKAPGVDAARFRLAKLYADKKDYASARQVLETIVSSSEDAAGRNRARLTIAYMLELEGSADAVRSFTAIADDQELPGAVRAEAGYAAARLLIAAKTPKAKADALKMLAKVLALNAGQNGRGSQATALWQQRAAELKASLD